MKYKIKLHHFLSYIILLNCLFLQIALGLDDKALKSYKPLTVYKPVDLPALTWLTNLQDQWSKIFEVDVFKNNKSNDKLKSITIEISATISGKYGLTKRQATLEEASQIYRCIRACLESLGLC